MKLYFMAVCTLCILFGYSESASVRRPRMITVADLARLDRRELDYLENFVRTKRSGDLFSGLKSKIGQKIKSKLGLLSHQSSSHHSTYASPHHEHEHEHGHGYDHDHGDAYSKMSFDFWTLKKSIFNTLLQAAKAIKGGIIAIKGQLIKGSGSLISAKGKLIKAKGEAISSIGKNIATSAVLAHTGPSAHSGPSASGHDSGPTIEYEHPSSHGYDGYASHSSPGVEYGSAPHHYSKPSPSYLPHKYHSYEAPHKNSHGSHAGILILKKVPSAHGHEIHHHEIHHDTEPIHSPKPTSSTIKGLVGKFLAATAKASASAAAHASSVVAHKTASIVSQLGKAAAVGSAAAVASLSSSKEPEHHSEHYSEYYPSHPESYEYDNSGSHHDHYSKYNTYSDASNIYDSHHASTENENAYSPKSEHLFSTISALRDGKSVEVQSSYDTPTNSYGEPLNDHSSTSLKQSVTGNNPTSFHELNMDTLNMYSGMNDHLSQYPTKNTDFSAPSMHLSLSHAQTAAENTKPHLYFGVNLPLETSDFSNTNNNYNSFLGSGSLDYNNQYNFDTNPTSSIKHIDFDTNNPDLHKLLGPTSLIESSNTNKGIGFLPTPATKYNHPDFTQHDNFYTSSLRGNKRKRSPSRHRKLPRYTFIKTVGYDHIGPHGPIKL